MSTIDKILLGLVSFLISFIITMIIVFCVFQQIPDTLVDGVLTLAGGEGIITFAIWWIKKKYGTEKTKKKEANENEHQGKTDK